MRIIVVGLGKVGQIITKYLADEGHDVIVIDKNFTKVEEVVDNYDVMGINGNGANNDVLKEATVDQADIVIAVTTSDELNILVGLLSKKLGAQHCIVRVRNPDYSNQRQFLQESLGFSMVINPEFEAANEIRRMILFPSALKVELFAGGMVEMVEFVVKKGCPLIESPLSDINKFTKSNVLISAVKTKDNVVIPNGDFIIEQGDHIFVVGLHKDLLHFSLDMKFLSHKIKDVMIIGGSKIAYYLTKQLGVLGIKTKIFEKNRERCIELTQKLKYSTIIEADGNRHEILLEEGIDRADAIVTLTGMDEENIVLALLAKKLGVKKAIAKVNHSILSQMQDEMNLDNIIDPKSIIASHILRYVRMKACDDSNIANVYKNINEDIEAIEFVVNEKTKYIDTPLKKLRIKDQILMAGIVRNHEMIIPKGDTAFQIDDKIVIVTVKSSIKKFNDIFEV
ncbi:Trk system potassium transporter TrkA [[Clostridium] spiroforme]|nr:Trk system potassium transporter TrkA [Thomasclavelia spiroformis]MBM6881318.1 Trk system potassium transporter TrkA [Thomasclavelia spiroformis]